MYASDVLISPTQKRTSSLRLFTVGSPLSWRSGSFFFLYLLPRVVQTTIASWVANRQRRRISF